MIRVSLSSGVALIALSGVAYGQSGADGSTNVDEERLATVEVTGFRPVSEADITSSVAIIDAGDLGVRNNPYLADELRAVPGLGVSRSGGAGALTQVRIRGGEANHTMVLLDGIEISDPTTGETDFGLLTGLNIAKVEVARGEQSTLFGSDAIGGVVSIYSAADDGARGQIEAGNRDTFRLDGSYGWALQEANITAAMSGFATEGVDTSGQSSERDGYENLAGLLRGNFDIGNDWAFRGLLRYGESEVEADSDLNFDGILDNADRVTQSQQLNLGGVLQGDGFGLNHLIRANFGDVVRENFADGISSDETTGERKKLSYSPSYQTDISGGTVTLSGLIDWESEDYTRVGAVSFFGDPNQSASFETLGLAGEARASLGALSLNASVRHDDNDGRFEDAETWRIGGAYSFDFGGKLRASAGTGIKNPTFTELFGFFPASFVGNPDLVPEKSTSWEIGWDQSHDSLSWSLTYFDAELEDEIFDTFTPDFSSSSAANRAGDSARSGIEFAADWQINDAFSLNGAVSDITSENDTGADEVRVPDWTASLALDWQSTHKDGLRAGLALDHVGKQLDFNFGTFPTETVALDDYTLVAATAEYPITDKLSLTLRGENLTDETVTDVFGFFGPGASVLVGIKLR